MSPKTLILLAKAPSETIPGDLRAGDIPRIEYVELALAIGAEILDFRSVKASTNPLVRAAARKGPLYGLTMLGILRRNEFDHIYATGEDIGMPLAAACHATGYYGHVTVVIHQCDTPKRRFILRALGDGAWRNVICLAYEQWRILTQEIGIPAKKVHRMNFWIDARFYDPAAASLSGPGDYTLSCGRESRDYETLLKAASGLPYQFQVVASGWAPHAGFDPATGIQSGRNISVLKGMLSYRELRDLYARSRFVITPLKCVNYAAGVTSICEGMAMGKAIIASDSSGIRDYVREGVSGLLVPVGDAAALQRAIRTLWEDPERCAAMGHHNRRWVEEVLSVDQYVKHVAGLLLADLRHGNGG